MAARTATRTREQAGTQPRPRVRDFSGTQARFELEFDSRTAFDFVVSLSVAAGEESDLLAEDKAWLERKLEELPAEMRTEIAACCGESSLGVLRAIPSLVIGRSDITDAASLVAALNDMSEHEVATVLVTDMLAAIGSEELVARVVAGDEDAIAEVNHQYSDLKGEDMSGLLRDVDTQVRRSRSVLNAWLPAYQEVEPRISQMLERDVTSRQRQARSTDMSGLIEQVTGGVRWLPDAAVRRVIMAPTYFGRPYNYVYQGAGWRLFCYPLAEEMLGPADASVPSQQIVRLYRALGDTTRLRVLHILADGDRYLTELAQALELSKPTMKHHLALLRAAGLVTVTEEGGLTYYSLRRERLAEAGVELQRFVG
jgi:DNA-binding transcriptional ArsR family regulator